MKILWVGVVLAGAAFVVIAAMHPSSGNTYNVPAEPLPASEYSSYRGVNIIVGNPVDYSHLRALGANWVALVVQCNHNGTQTDCSNTPDDNRIRAEMDAARAVGLHVMLKPHIETTQYHWRGEISFRSKVQVQAWFAGYVPIVLRVAALQPDAVAVGTELRGLSGNEAQWRALVKQVRQEYKGLVTYASNYDEAPNIRWWDALDFIGVDAYFPLLAPEHATVDELVRAWIPYRDQLAALSESWHKPVVFTEIGYQSRMSSYQTPWQRDSGIADNNAQAFAYQAVFETFRNLTWWAGALFWDWQPDKKGLEFMPADKPALGVLMSNWRAESNPDRFSATNP